MDEFFSEDRLVQNLAFLLGIDSSRIRVVSVVRETTLRRRKRQNEETEQLDVNFEIGNPPLTTVSSDNDTSSENMTSTMPTTNSSSSLSFEQLEQISETLVNVIQTGQLASDLNATVVNVEVMEPEPSPMDPTDGVRATPETGGPQPGNDTVGLPTFYDMQLEEEIAEENSSAPVVFTIPTELVVEREGSTTGVEGKPLSQPPIITMLDNTGNIIENLGLSETWKVRIIVEQGPDGAFLTNATAPLLNGRSEFSGLTFSYPGTYRLSFEVEFPESADFSVASRQEVTIAPRNLELVIVIPPSDGNTSFPLYPYPSVQLYDNDRPLTEHDWRNVTWFVCATLKRSGTSSSTSSCMWQEELNDGQAQFSAIQPKQAGQYHLQLYLLTVPESTHLPSPILSGEFTVIQLPFTRLEFVFEGDFNAVLGETSQYENDFVTVFREAFFAAFPAENIEIYNITIRRGSIVVSFFVTSRSATNLLEYVEEVVSSNGTLDFSFRGAELTPSSIVMDSSYPIDIPEEEENDYTEVILACALAGGIILLLVFILILILTIYCRHRRKTGTYKV